MELYPDAMGSQVPVSVVSPVLKVAEDGHGHVQAWELLPAHWAEPGVLHGAGDCILPQPLVELHLVKSPNAASEFLVFPNLPGNEERVVFVTEGGDLRGLEVVEVAVEDIKTKVTHLMLDDPEAPPLRCHHGP